MTNAAESEFRDAYRRRQRARFLGSAQELALAATVMAVFAWATSLDILRHAALLAVLLPLVPLFVGLLRSDRDPGSRRLLLRGTAAMLIAAVAVGMAWTLPGLGFGYERKLGELPPMRVRQVDIDARRHPSQDAILEIIAQAREQPTMSTLRPLIPYLHDNHLLLTMGDGRTRPASSVVREVLLANPARFHRSLHEEGLTMASLLPLEGPVPPVVEVDVAGRLRETLGLLIELHSEQRMQGRFDVPSVGLVLPVAIEDPEQGMRVVRHEVGITYPFAGIPAYSDAELDFVTVSNLLEMVRKDLGY